MNGASLLIRDLGYRPPGPRDLARIFRKPRWIVPDAERPEGHGVSVPAVVLAADPLVSYSGLTLGARLGVASLTGLALAAKPAWFLLSPTWSIDNRGEARALRREAVLHRLANPRHRFVFLCNTEDEAALMRSLGEAAIVHVKTTNTCERTFRPLAGATREFDAVYNAQLAPWKRHELARAIPRCSFLFYRGISSTSESEAAMIADHLEAAPGHVFVNEYDSAGMPVRLSPDEVNRELNRACVGLCLSAEEGAMFACPEYLLAGLPVVTTPNRGGRDFFLDDETCITVPPDPRAIAEAVAALKVRNIPPEHVREKTLARMRPQRERFIGLVRDILKESGSAETFESPWPLKRPVLMPWVKAKDARMWARHRTVDDLRAGPEGT